VPAALEREMPLQMTRVIASWLKKKKQKEFNVVAIILMITRAELEYYPNWMSFKATMT